MQSARLWRLVYCKPTSRNFVSPTMFLPVCVCVCSQYVLKAEHFWLKPHAQRVGIWDNETKHAGTGITGLAKYAVTVWTAISGIQEYWYSHNTVLLTYSSGKKPRKHIPQDELHCQHCGQKYTEKESYLWIGCESHGCWRWWHYTCVHLPCLPADNETWICPVCSTQ